MSHTEAKPESAFTILKIAQNDIELDKTRDGRYWFLLHWPDNEVVLRLRIAHSSVDDPDDFVAEMKVVGPDDPAGRSEEGFSVLSSFMFSPFALDAAEPDIDEFPSQYRDEFVSMVCYWGFVLKTMECGAAFGSMSPVPASSGAKTCQPGPLV
jgi:hypothetical protein